MDPPLLARHVFVDTDRPAHANERVSQIFAPHELAVSEPDAAFHAVHNHARLGTLSLNYIRFTPGVTIRAKATRRYYLVLMPQSGSCTVGYGARDVAIAHGTLTVINPLEPMRLDWGDRCEMFVLKVERSALEDLVSERLGRPPTEPVLFDFDRPIPAADCQGFVQLAHLVAQDLDRPRPVMTSPQSEPLTEALCLGMLIDDLPHNHRSQIAKPRSPVAPYYVKRVEEFLQLHADRPITVADMVTISGVSARSLFKGFRDFRGVGPKAYLKSLRLDRAYADLAASQPGQRRVSQVAGTWGFGHLGNFAKDYRRKFGETPSATLHKPTSRPRRRTGTIVQS